MGMKRWVPWYAKIAVKLALARLPFSYAAWRNLSLFVHGSMRDPDYAHRVFRKHFDRSPFARRHERNGFVALEIGPGDSLLSAMLAKTYGATACYLIDSGSFATESMQPYREAVDYLRSLNLSPPDLNYVSDLKGLLTLCNAVYGTEGLPSMHGISSSSVDFVWSHVVLEHIRRREFKDFIHELRRVLRSDGVCSHRIDLTDCLGGALNNLRIPSKYWEADWMASSGFYTNRIRFSEMIELFRESGFSVELLSVDRWSEVPTPRAKMATEFARFADEDLRVQAFDVLLRPQ
jgi:SAM-dependent methyltransferase